MKTLVWDMDGVLFPDRGTTWMADLRQGDPSAFLERFLHQDPKTSGKFNYDMINDWSTKKNNGHPITTYGHIARFLTDLRHVYGVFTEIETTYTKNAILEGLTLHEIYQMPKKIKHNVGVLQVTNALRNRSRQVIFSKSNGALVNAERAYLYLDHGEGVRPLLSTDDGERFWYDYSSNASQNAKLTGTMEDNFSKSDRIVNYLEFNRIDPSSLVTIDDTDIDMLLTLRGMGATIVGFYNKEDPILKQKHLDALTKASIPVLHDTLEPMQEIVLNPGSIKLYCK